MRISPLSSENQPAALAYLRSAPYRNALPLSNITAILQAIPLLMTALSVVLLHESVGWRRWTAVVVGFVGVLLVIQPGIAGLEPAAALALITVIGVAAPGSASLVNAMRLSVSGPKSLVAV